MKKFIIIVLFFISFGGYAQKISFSYDASGNQIIRTWCPGCVSKTSAPVKEVKDLVAADMQKFLPEDIFSYYPNPVKEQLYLKWELKDNNTISAIKVFNLNGAVLKTFENLNDVNNQTIEFQSLPSGIYILELTERSGDVKIIKIIKQ